MTTIKLPIFGITIQRETTICGVGSITCDSILYELCPGCGTRDCLHKCDWGALNET